MKPLEAPAADAKCGLKIDYVAKRLGQALQPLGFKRKARLFSRAVGSGPQAHWQIIQLQGDKWNEGPRGAFYVNLAVQFPALLRLCAQRPGSEWLLQHVDEVDECLGHLRQRLGPLQAALPPEHPCARPAHNDEFKFSPSTDLTALTDSVVQATLALAVPWLEQHASLRALAEFDGSLLGADVDVRVAAAVLLQERGLAQQILAQRHERFSHLPNTALHSLRTWLTGLGLDVAALPTEARPPAPSAWEQRRQAAQHAEEAALAQQARALREQAGPTPATLAQAWVAEHRAQWRRDPQALVDLPSGPTVAQLPTHEREAVLCALLHGLAQAEATAPPRHPIHTDPNAFDTDDSVRHLLAALLPTLPAPSEPTVLTVVQHMQALLPRWQQEMVTGGYPWGLPLLARWLTGPAGAPHRAALQAAVADWLAALATHTVARHTTLNAALAQHQAEALANPAHPMYAVYQEAQQREAELAATQAMPSPAELQRRLSEYPEQCMNPADKQAVASLRTLLRRDPRSGLLPLAWDADEWGQSTQAAWQALPEPLRHALSPTLQAWAEGVDTRPTQTFLRTLRAQVAALPDTLGSTLTPSRAQSLAPSLAAHWQAWLATQLARFAHSSGHTEWATTGPRPGVGARLGEASENLLLGLLWWAWLDPDLPTDTLDTTLTAVSTGAWQHLPNVGARAPAVGGLALRLRAGLSDAARQHVQALGEQRGTSKQLKQAVQRALKDAQPRPVPAHHQ